jgi:hypothetical protein
MVSLLEEARAALPERDSALRVRVLARLAIALYFSPFAARCDDLSQQAVAMARRLGDPTILARIQRQHPALGRHLSVTIKTGLFCSYNPERSISWLV